MSKNKQAADEKKVVHPIIELKKHGTLILPDEIITQVTYLHGRIGPTEWSGMLLYDVVSGDPGDPENFVLEAKHIFLMDIGTAAYTEYETDEDIVELYEEVEGAMEMKTGHIHTHHNMKTFFSGTDTSELQDNVDKHNYYLSLIVNMGGVYSAKVAFLSDVHSSSKLNFIDDAGKTKHFKTDHMEKSMVVIDMDLHYKYNNEFFFNRYEDVRTKIKKAAEVKSSKAGYSYGKKYYGGRDNELFDHSLEGKNLPMKLDDVDPEKMENHHVEKLARNVFSVNAELTEMKSTYQILFRIANANESDRDQYYTFLATNLEIVIENFFDQELEVDEMQAVVLELIGSMVRFSGIPVLGDVIKGIDEVLDEFMAAYEITKADEALKENSEEEKLAQEIDELK